MKKFKIEVSKENTAQIKGEEPHNDIWFTEEELMEAEDEAEAIAFIKQHYIDEYANIELIDIEEKEDSVLFILDDGEMEEYFFKASEFEEEE